MAKSKNPPKKEHDPLRSLKFKGYCWAHTAPGENTTITDLTNFAKFYLCKHAHRLWKDPIWDQYTDEEILIEYFGHLFSKDEVTRKEFEAEINAGTEVYGDDIYDWLDKKIAENQKEMKKKLDEMPDRVSFSPDKNEDIEE